MQAARLEKLVFYLFVIAIGCGSASPVMLYIGMAYGGVGGHGGDWTVWIIGLAAFFSSWALMAASVAISLFNLKRGIAMRWWSVLAIGLLICMSVVGAWGLGG